MNPIDLIRRLHQHRAWVNEQLLKCATKISEDQLRQSFGIGQGTAWRSLCHMMAAEYVWLAALEGDRSCMMPGDIYGKLPGNQEGADAINTMDELADSWKRLSERWQTYLATLTVSTLEETVYRTSTSSLAGQTIGVKRCDVLLHVCTHAHYTTAQVMNMLRHLGCDPLPEVMLMSLARFESVSRSS